MCAGCPAARALAAIGGERAVDGLIEALGDEHSTTPYETIIKVLRAIGTPKALAAAEAWDQRTT